MALSDAAIKELTDYIEVQGLAWAKEFIAFRKSWLESNGIKATGELIRSLEVEVVSTIEDAATTKIEIAFAGYGRYIDMKNLNAPAGGDDYITGLETWIVKKGLTQKMIASFMSKRKLRVVPQSILNQLAWSIAISRIDKVKRRRQWYNKPKSAAITELYNLVASGIPSLVSEEIKKTFNA